MSKPGKESVLPEVPDAFQKQERDIVSQGGANPTAKPVPPRSAPPSAGFDQSAIHLANVEIEMNEPLPKQPAVLVGPVVGRVSATNARLLLELDQRATITLRVEVESSQSAPTMGPKSAVLHVDGDPGAPKAKTVRIQMEGQSRPKVACAAQMSRDAVPLRWLLFHCVRCAFVRSSS